MCFICLPKSNFPGKSPSSNQTNRRWRVSGPRQHLSCGPYPPNWCVEAFVGIQWGRCEELSAGLARGCHEQMGTVCSFAYWTMSLHAHLGLHFSFTVGVHDGLFK